MHVNGAQVDFVAPFGVSPGSCLLRQPATGSTIILTPKDHAGITAFLELL